jgi:hypothetical protein
MPVSCIRHMKRTEAHTAVRPRVAATLMEDLAPGTDSMPWHGVRRLDQFWQNRFGLPLTPAVLQARCMLPSSDARLMVMLHREKTRCIHNNAGWW